MKLVAIDPGTEKSAFVILDTDSLAVLEHGIINNKNLLLSKEEWEVDHMAIEMVTSYGMPVGESTFKTVLWIGRFMQKYENSINPDITLIPRNQIKYALCHRIAKITDAIIRQRLIDIYGGEDKAIGGKKCSKCKGKGWFGAGRAECPVCHGGKWKTRPGPMHGVIKDEIQALALGVTFAKGEFNAETL